MNTVKKMSRRSAALAAFLAAFLTVMGLAPRLAQAVVVVRTAVNYHPVARAVVVTGAAVATAAVVGSAVRTLPPHCTSVVVGGVAYQQCGSAYYQPRYAGSQVTYVVVNPPR